jgi:hypothetical protein
MKRSVSTELDLEPGTYSVLLKITAKRFPEAETVDDVIEKTCQTRRKKLQAVGLSYDMAHAKGHFQELETEKMKREKLERRERRKAMAKKMHEARIQQRKKTKLRNLKLDLKRQEREMKRFAQESEQDKLEPFGALGIIDPTSNSYNSSFQPLTAHPQAITQPGNLTPRSTSPNGRTGPSPLRASTTFPTRPPPNLASLAPLARHTRPDIRVQRARVAGDGGRLTLSDVSSDELSWDSELDAPSDSTSGADDDNDDARAPSLLLAPDAIEAAARRCAACGGDDAAAGAGGREEDSDEEEGGPERDPWNAVCVVGLRVYSTESDVRVEVVRGGGRGEKGKGVGVEGGGGQIHKKLDVDDAAKDAVEAMRTPVNSPVGPSGVATVGVEALLG